MHIGAMHRASHCPKGEILSECMETEEFQVYTYKLELFLFLIIYTNATCSGSSLGSMSAIALSNASIIGRYSSSGGSEEVPMNSAPSLGKGCSVSFHTVACPDRMPAGILPEWI